MRNYHHLPSGSVDRARDLRRNMTDAEKHLWRALREAFPDVKKRKQVPYGPYYADFLIFSARLIIEVDGGQHAEAAEPDAARTWFFGREGYRVLRFWNNDVLENTDGVISAIGEALSLSQREREGAPKARKGEGDRTPKRLRQSSSPSHRPAAGGPLPLPKGEGN